MHGNKNLEDLFQTFFGGAHKNCLILVYSGHETEGKLYESFNMLHLTYYLKKL